MMNEPMVEGKKLVKKNAKLFHISWVMFALYIATLFATVEFKFSLPPMFITAHALGLWILFWFIYTPIFTRENGRKFSLLIKTTGVYTFGLINIALVSISCERVLGIYFPNLKEMIDYIASLF